MPMSYESKFNLPFITVQSQCKLTDHRDHVNLMHAKNDSKVTHAGRPYTAKTSREHGAAVVNHNHTEINHSFPPWDLLHPMPLGYTT